MKKTKKSIKAGNCEVLNAVKTTSDGLKKDSLCKLLETLRSESKHVVEVNHIRDKKYYIKYKKNEGIIEIPEEITKIGLCVAIEYLKTRAGICNYCAALKGGNCLRNLFV